MFRDLRGLRGAPALAVMLALAGCQTTETVETSTKARVNPKPGAVWGQDLANGLGLKTWELCSELGTADCIQDAHRITLGGVEAERLGIDEPLPNPSISKPIAVDRVAIAACGERYARDQAGSPVIFGPVIASDDADSRATVSRTLVRRLLARDATDDEVAGLEALHADIASVAEDPARDWSIGACVVVATSLEALFY